MMEISIGTRILMRMKNMSEDKYNLERFVRRQETDYDRAYKELSEENKRSNWM